MSRVPAPNQPTLASRATLSPSLAAESLPPDGLSAALEAAVNRFGALVRQVAWRHRLDGDDLDEVLQDVRLRLWRARGASEQLTALSTSYVYRTASSAALDLIRRKRRARASQPDAASVASEGEADIEDVTSNLAGRSDPSAAVEAAEVNQAVMTAIERIPKSRRGVVRMYLIGHPLSEIAGLMGWSEPKTRNLLYRGLADLRGHLTAMGYGPAGTPG